MLPKKRIQVVMVDENGVEHVVSSEDAPAQSPAFGETERAAIKSEVLALAAKAAAVLGLHDFRYPQIIDQVMRSARGGVYKTAEHAVYMNMLLHKNPKMYRDTLIHECAHAVQMEVLRNSGVRGMALRGSLWGHHGLQWKSIMHRMGGEPDAYHDYDVVAEMPNKYLAQVCACGYRHQVGKRKIANAIKKGAKWRCGRCQRPLDLTRFTPTAAVEEPMMAVAGGKRRHGKQRRVHSLVGDVRRLMR
jgi:predicted SprT family Zn-dependent metalloprotease